MVESTLNLDSIFNSLADPTRRDMLCRLTSQFLSVGELAKPYDLTYAAISKHLRVLERARLIRKQRRGKQQIVQISPEALRAATDYLDYYEGLLNQQLDALEEYLSKGGNI